MHLVYSPLLNVQWQRNKKYVWAVLFALALALLVLVWQISPAHAESELIKTLQKGLEDIRIELDTLITSLFTFAIIALIIGLLVSSVLSPKATAICFTGIKICIAVLVLWKVAGQIEPAFNLWFGSGGTEATTS